MKMGLKIGGSGTAKLHAGLAALNGSDVLVGIPQDDSRSAALLQRAAALSPLKSGKPSKKAQRLVKAALQDITNAELLFIFTNGSPVRGQPPRVVIEAAIAQPDTAALIAKQFAAAATAALNGDMAGMARYLDRAGTIGEAASKQWFTNPANGWLPNAPSTIDKKGSDTPGIDTGAMRRAITHVVELASSGGRGDDGVDSEAEYAGHNGAEVPEDTELVFGEDAAEILAVL